jgi:hypothetical protein
MANKKISQLTAGGIIVDTDLIEVETNAGASRKQPISALFSFLNNLLLARGTSFPGSPATNDRFYRNDRQIEYYYDGTSWLSTQIFGVDLNANPAVSANTTGYQRVANPQYGGALIYITEIVSMYILTGTGNWTYLIRSVDDVTATTLATNTFATGVSGQRYAIRDTVNAVVANTVESFDTVATENSGTATFEGAVRIEYRMIG